MTEQSDHVEVSVKVIVCVIGGSVAAICVVGGLVVVVSVVNGFSVVGDSPLKIPPPTTENLSTSLLNYYYKPSY